jgi:hypothetical protein
MIAGRGYSEVVTIVQCTTILTWMQILMKNTEALALEQIDDFLRQFHNRPAASGPFAT